MVISHLNPFTGVQTRLLDAVVKDEALVGEMALPVLFLGAHGVGVALVMVVGWQATALPGKSLEGRLERAASHGIAASIFEF